MASDAVAAQDGPEPRDYPALPVHERPVAVEREDLVLVCFHSVLPLADTLRKVSHGHLGAFTGASPLRIIGDPSEGDDGRRKERERASHHERHAVGMAFVLDRT